MPRKVSFVVLFLLLCAGGIAWMTMGAVSQEKQPGASASPPKVPVSVEPAQRRDIPIYLTGLGNVQAFNTVTVRTQVDGQLKQIAFKEGQEVKAGDLLAQIDSRSFQAALDQAIAKRAQDQAQLANARNDLQRYTALVEKNYVARQQLDTTRAQVAQLEAAVQGDDAVIENARVTLGYATIRSPIDGRVGIRQVDAGNIVHVSDAAGLVMISQMKPISVLFTLPEDDLPKVVKAGDHPEVAVLSRDGNTSLDEGHLELVDNQIDQSTGTIRLKAAMPNQNGTLWPGQFVTARLQVGVEQNVVTIPMAAVQRGLDGSFCFVVGQNETVDVRPLKLGETTSEAAVVLDGVAAGERVVTAGQYRLQRGSVVEVRTAGDDRPTKEARD